MAEFEAGQRLHVRRPGVPTSLTVQMAQPDGRGGWSLFVLTPDGSFLPLTVAPGDDTVEVLLVDGAAPSERVLAGMWTQWMAAANHNARTTLLASTPLRPYAHQANAVYGAMLPQPQLRFLLADEPGTGKTIMAGMYLREMQRLGLIRKGLVVAPAGLVTKWMADFEHFFGGGLRRITADTVREHALDVDHDMWIVSLELAATNGNVQDAIRPDKAGWDVVVFDEAHRLTPTAGTFHRVGRLLTRETPRALLMTATPHRGSEWLFRHLLNMVDPDVYPDPGMDKPSDDEHMSRLKPGAIHFLRRMKEALVDYDGQTRLFLGRTAHNFAIPLNPVEASLYVQALAMVDEFFPRTAQPLARMVYGKRAASTLYSLKETLLRRASKMGQHLAVVPDAGTDPFDVDTADAGDEAEVVNADSVSAKRERGAIKDLVAQIDDAFAKAYTPSKWRRLIDECLVGNGIVPGGSEQAVVFTEYADSAEWIQDQLLAEGFTARVYSGRQAHVERDEVRAAFMRRDYQIIVSTDAGNEGIDLQSAHVLVNYDIPWSLVKLEQRMGRIHRVGQNRNVELYNLVATETREGDTLLTLLNNFVTAANELDGQLFDSLSLVAELAHINFEDWLKAIYGNDEDSKQRAMEAARRVNAADVRNRTTQLREDDRELESAVEARAALTLLQDDLLERINPAIVEAYLQRLAATGLLTCGPAPQGEGILRLARSMPLPASLTPEGRPGNSALVAVSGDALSAAARETDTTDVVALGPGEQGFTDLLSVAHQDFEADMFRGGLARDTTSMTGYDLYSFTATFTEAGGKKTTRWASLIRVTDTGDADLVRWETLANLLPATPEDTPPPTNPLYRQRAIDVALAGARTAEAEQRTVRRTWFDKARTDLMNLPFMLTKDITDPAAKAAAFNTLNKRTKERLVALEALVEVSVSTPDLVGHLRVQGAAQPPTLEEKNSELIATHHVINLLQKQNFTVTDVHLEGRGYDLLARRGAEQRMVEVKGKWNAASATGIEMTGREVLIATQHGKDYWLYVIDQCRNGSGTVFGIYPDPMAAFRDVLAGAANVRVPGKALAAARTEQDPQ